MSVKMTLGKRIGSIVLIMLLLLILIGISGYKGLSRVLAVMDLNYDISMLSSKVTDMKGYTDQYVIGLLQGDTTASESAQKEVFSVITKLIENADTIRRERHLDSEQDKQFELMAQTLSQYRDIFQAYIQNENRRADIVQEGYKAHEDMAKAINEGLLSIKDMQLLSSEIAASFTSFTFISSEGNWTNLKKNAASLKDSIDAWHKLIENSEDLQKVAKIINTQFGAFSKNIDELHENVLNRNKLRHEMGLQKENLVRALNALTDLGLKSSFFQIRTSKRLIIWFGIAAVLAGAIYAGFLTRNTVNNIKKVISGVLLGAHQVTIGADQVANAGSRLAKGATEQAASIEEISASLEEMSSMSRQNANNSNEAKNLMSDVTSVLKRVNDHMNDMAEAMGVAAKSGQATVKIIKTIDEIAFQTNLLALNAAVEAARAGEAGAGFAVVAGEVRNLAMRAAKAARETDQLIAKTIQTLQTGANLTELTRGAFKENMTLCDRVACLVDEIAGASKDQADGVEHINRAVIDIDKVVQQNAASTEESASAAEEMTTEAQGLKGYILDLASLVGHHTDEAATTELGNQTESRIKAVLKKPLLEAPNSDSF
jgi:hypothetical protein